MVLSDSKNHSPGIDNEGPFLMMNPFSSRCCQHNHAAGWVYFLENSWMATPDNGLAAQLYTEGSVKAQLGNGAMVTIAETTKYPFEEAIHFTIHTEKPNSFPLYLRIPEWANYASVFINGKQVKVKAIPGEYLLLKGKWKNNDKIVLQLPMHLKLREWAANKNSVSLNYGPLTYSLKIEEHYTMKDGTATVAGDSHWQEHADPQKWPSYEISATSPWNFGLVLNKDQLTASFAVVKHQWPADNNPFTNDHQCKGKTNSFLDHG